MERVSGQKLLAWRLTKGLTQKQASKLAQIDQASWHQYENGRIPRDVAVISRLVKLTKGSTNALKLEDFSETAEERTRRRVRIEARTARKDESGTSLEASSKAAG
jgi:transcriptional regulator with XRE-family HTH domain